MRDKFKGYYFKHQTQENTLAVIPGRSETEAFAQVITADSSFYIPYKLEDYAFDGVMRVGKNKFSKSGIVLHIDSGGLQLHGKLGYGSLTPIDGDIMGPFRHLPMECRHTVVSMRHPVRGGVVLNGKFINFTEGVGYIEGDSGTSFPECYSWVQCNLWNNGAKDCAVMCSVAKIPFYGLQFWGCIAVVHFRGREFRFATYKGAKIRERAKDKLVLTQGELRLQIAIGSSGGHMLYAPDQGVMGRAIFEGAAVGVHITLERGGRVLFDGHSDCAGYEFVE